MKNLENYGVLQLNTKEMKEIEGGFWPAIIVGALIGALLTQDLGDLAQAFNDGRAAAK